MLTGDPEELDKTLQSAGYVIIKNNLQIITCFLELQNFLKIFKTFPEYRKHVKIIFK